VTLVVVLAFAGLYAVFAVLATAPVQATGPLPGYDDIYMLTTDDTFAAAILDGRGELIGYATHRGGLRCDEGLCSRQTEVQIMSATTRISYTYSFESLQAVYPDEERVAVLATAVVTESGQTTAFPVSVTFQNNGDGTIYTRYDAAHPATSFIIPRTAGYIAFE
jgi:hypothetical protein